MSDRIGHAKIERILVPTDFSEASRAAVDEAASWARMFGAHLHLLHAMVPFGPFLEPNISPAVPPPETMLQVIEEDARLRLRKLAESISGSKGPVETHCLRGGAPAEVIVTFAEQHGIDLVVMSSHGRRGVRRLLIGSVTEEVIRRSPCPVLVERRDGSATQSSAARRIVVPVDFSEASAQSLQRARMLASTLGAEIDLLTVIQDPIYPAPYGAGELPALVDHLPEIEGRARRELESLAGESESGQVAHAFVRRGDPALEILAHARDRDCGLIVISTHGTSGLSRLLLGSVTEKVLRRTTSAVFVVPAAIAFTD